MNSRNCRLTIPPSFRYFWGGIIGREVFTQTLAQEVQMTDFDQTLTQRLCEENPHFRKLHEQHVLFEKQLQKLDERVFLSPEDELDRKKIQKLKLAGKDEMERIMKEYRS
ncbi:MAG TPA: YdcH family protein [Desulfuromonadales bacterium]|nr:YdcH family protein [Desulfuromonadales bacterium]